MSLNAAILDSYVFEDSHEVVYLERTPGKTVADSDRVPKIFEAPLRKSEETTAIAGFSSGIRSAIVEDGGKNYKLKGFIPSSDGYEIPDVPYGCMKESFCLSEVRASKTLSDFGEINGVPAPMTPVCHFIYEKLFQDERVSCNVHRILGNDRFAQYISHFTGIMESAYRKGLRDREKISEVRRQLTNRIGNWIGFWYGALENAGLSWGTTFLHPSAPQSNLGSDNMVLYPAGKGIGIGIIDLDRSGLHPGERERKWELCQLRNELSCFDGVLYYLERGEKAISINCYVVRQACLSIGEWAYDNSYNKRKEFFGGVPFPDEDSMEIIRSFDEGRRGKAPLPIDREFFKNGEVKLLSLLR